MPLRPGTFQMFLKKNVLEAVKVDKVFSVVAFRNSNVIPFFS